jgi:TonB family protein
MDELILYLLKSGISIVLLYAIYWLFLSRDTFFKMNRVYLVSSVIFSLVFPLLPITLPFSGPEDTYMVMLDTIVINASKINPAVSNHLETFQIIGIIYLTGMTIFMIRFLFQIGQLVILIRNNGITRQQGLSIVLIDRNYAPFSFFGLIFINRKELNEKQVQEIIDHELVHVNQQHSLDLILIEIMTIIQWFNPVVWFYRNSIKTVHEYLADEGVLLKGHNAIDYQKLLLAQSTGIQVNDLTNNFNHSLIKKRIIMMTKSKSTLFARLKLLTAMPVAFMLVVAFTASPIVETIAQVDKQKQEQKQLQQESTTTVADEDIFTVVEQMPVFPGGDEGRIKYLVENIKYPEAARKAGIEGTVFVTFVVEKDGSVSNARILRGIGGGCDEEALRVVSAMPTWKPGVQRGKPVRVQFNVPLKFNLGNDEKEEKLIDSNTLDKKAPPPPPKKEKK